MKAPEQLLEIRDYAGTGYKPLIDYGEWRVAILRYIDELAPEKIDKMQRHHETDEVFVLLTGRCILFVGDGDEQVSNIYAQDMEPLKLYNVKRNVWHGHTLSANTTVLIVENRDTTTANSSNSPLTQAQQQLIAELTRTLSSQGE
jgi:ureidoglycolate hydrolase